MSLLPSGLNIFMMISGILSFTPFLVSDFSVCSFQKYLNPKNLTDSLTHTTFFAHPDFSSDCFIPCETTLLGTLKSM